MAGLAVRLLLCLKPRLLTRVVAFQMTSRERQWNRTVVTENKNLVHCSWRRLASSVSSNNQCWKCGMQTKSSLLCELCKALQKPKKDLNYFKLFGLKPTFDVESSRLTKHFRKLQSILHPDKYANSSEEERMISEEYSSFVNKAYSTLQQPLSRGFYLLELHGIHLEESKTQSNPIFLMELMERNEEVLEANNVTKMKDVIEKNKQALDTLNREVSEAFQRGDLQGAKNALIKMKYFVSIEEKIKAMKADKGFID